MKRILLGSTVWRTRPADRGLADEEENRKERGCPNNINNNINKLSISAFRDNNEFDAEMMNEDKASTLSAAGDVGWVPAVLEDPGAAFSGRVLHAESTETASLPTTKMRMCVCDEGRVSRRAHDSYVDCPAITSGSGAVPVAATFNK